MRFQYELSVIGSYLLSGVICFLALTFVMVQTRSGDTITPVLSLLFFILEYVGVGIAALIRVVMRRRIEGASNGFEPRSCLLSAAMPVALALLFFPTQIILTLLWVLLALIFQNGFIMLGIVIGLVVLMVLLGPVIGLGRLLFGLDFLQRLINLRSHGTSRFANDAETRKHQGKDQQAGGLILGKQGNRFVYYRQEGHLLTFAPTGSGKGVSAVIPNLLTYEGSVLCIDPKGENAAITARQRMAKGQSVFVLDPWDLSGLSCSALNPLDWLQPDNPDLLEDARMIASALVVHDPREESHWDEEAKAFLTGLILYVAIYEEDPENRNLLTVRRYLNLSANDLDLLLSDMSQAPDKDGFVAATANRLAQKADRERSSVISTAQRHTHFLDGGRMRRVLGHSDFDLFSFKKELMSVFLVLPADRIETHNRWLRLVVSMAITAMGRGVGRPKLPVLFLLDEFAALGHLASVETAVGLMRGYGIKLWPILQDLPQLQAVYQQKWESFIANAGVCQAFGVRDKTTAEYLSKLMGQETLPMQTKNGLGDRNESFISRQLMMPEEVTRLDQDKELILMNGEYPMILTKVRYYADKAFQGLFDRNPYR